MTQEYRGPDRRAGGRAAVPMPVRQVAAGALAGLGCAAALDLAVLASHAGDPAQLPALAVVTWSAPLLASAALLVCAWRVGGRAAPAHWATAAALAGGVGPAVAWVAAGAAHPAGAPAAVTASLAAGLGAAAFHCRAALRGPEVQAGLRPALALLAGACLVLAVGAVTVALAGTGRPAWTPLAAAQPGVTRWVPAALGAVGGAALAGGAACLHGALRSQQLRGLSAMASLHRYRAELAQDRLRRHDARSALAAVRAASAVLTGQLPAVPAGAAGAAGVAGVIGSVGAAELASSVQAELSRVERLLAGATPAADLAADPAAAQIRPGVVDLREAAAPVVAAWRARGLDVRGLDQGLDRGLDGRAGDGPALVLGDVDGIRRLLGNLLANAERHAPGSPVRLTLLPGNDGRVVMTVHDDGPGVPATAREAVFAAGARLREDLPGEGLGLASARALAELDGGSMRLLQTPRGACFELRLPGAAAVARA